MSKYAGGVGWSSEGAEDIDALADFFVGGGVADSKVRILFAEYTARNNEQIVFDGFFDKGRCGAARGFDKGVEGTGGFWYFEFIFEAFVEQVAFFSVLLDVGSDIKIEGLLGGFLEGGGRADEGVLLDFYHLFEEGLERFVDGDIGHSPAGHSVGFAEAFEEDCLFVMLCDALGGAVVGEDVVDIVAEHDDVIYAGDLGDGF